MKVMFQGMCCGRRHPSCSMIVLYDDGAQTEAESLPSEPATVAVLSGGFFGFADRPGARGIGESGDPTIGGRFYNLGEPV